MKSPIKIALILSLIMPLLNGCTNTQAANTNSQYSTPRSGAESVSFSRAQLEAMLAPIALYPDTVLSHVLIAATYPLEVVEADRWAQSHSNLTGAEAVEAVDDRDWDPSVKALVAFPNILERMSDDLDWTQSLGDAFLADEEQVMDSIQTLRNRAYTSGNLDKVEHVRVIREDKIIMIEPAVERIVYVPAYDTRVVYGNWWWTDYPPVYWHHPRNYVYVSGFYWGPRVYLAPSFYFSACHWQHRRVVVVDHHHHNARFYNSRSVARHHGARHWNHNPVHRRGVAYHDNRTRERYHSPRERYIQERSHRRDTRQNSDILAPNKARDLRQGIDRGNTSRANGVTSETRHLERANAQRRIENGRMIINKSDAPRAEQLRERLGTRAQLNDKSGRSTTTTSGRELRPDIPRINRTESERTINHPVPQKPDRAQRGDGGSNPDEFKTRRVEQIDRTNSGRADRTMPQNNEVQRLERARTERPEAYNRAPERQQMDSRERPSRSHAQDAERRVPNRGGREL